MSIPSILLFQLSTNASSYFSASETYTAQSFEAAASSSGSEVQLVRLVRASLLRFSPFKRSGNSPDIDVVVKRKLCYCRALGRRLTHHLFFAMLRRWVDSNSAVLKRSTRVVILALCAPRSRKYTVSALTPAATPAV